MRRALLPLFVGLCTLPPPPASAQEPARAIIARAIEQGRGVSSRGTFTMTIHRPDWERSLSLRSWTRGYEDSLVRVVRPARDAGHATLTIDNNLWSFSPKVNRVIKLPSSMMDHSWMGSDFSNADVIRADDLLDEYQHTLLETVEMDGHAVHVIESVPHETAAVVWGREVLRIRDDDIVLEHAFYDQDDILIKRLVTLEIDERGGRTVPTRQRMTNTETGDEWTEIYVPEMEFDIELSDGLFTLSNLRNPRE